MSDKRKPNFFILGAPKCGTTSVAYWLRDHDNVFVSDPKEPHYFNTDSDFHDVFSLDQYEALFDDCMSTARSELVVMPAVSWRPRHRMGVYWA